MSRAARKQSASGVYHVMLRGNEQRQIFIDDGDKVRFLETLEKMKETENYELYAYCLMDNHVHLLLREKTDDIARVMKRICVSYVYYFNKKYKRTGHLFQDRYRSEVVEEDTYLLSVARYIHKNPLKAGMVKKVEDYIWSSYEQYIDTSEGEFNLIERSFLLSMLSDKEDRAKELFKNFTNDEDESEENFIEYPEDKVQEIEEEASCLELKKQINIILEKYGLNLECFKKCKDKKLRNNLLNEIKVVTRASVRELSSIMGISKDIIFRA